MDWLIVGVVLVALAIPVVVVLVLVGTLDRLRRPRMAQPIDGVLHVERVSSPTLGDAVPTLGDLVPAHEDFTATGMLSGPTLTAPVPVSVRGADWTNRWPQPGQSVRVRYDRSDPRRVELAS